MPNKTKIYKINFELARSLKWQKGSERQGVAHKHKKDKLKMEDRYNTSEARSDAGRFGRWLATRPAESWMFFVVGIFFGGLFF